MIRVIKNSSAEAVRSIANERKLGISATAIEKARKALRTLDPIFVKADAATPPFEWRSKMQGFRGLVRLIVEQQVSVASANATWKRLESGLGTIEVEEILAHTVTQLKIYGLSAQKAGYIRGIAEAVDCGGLDLAALGLLGDEAACAVLIGLKGVGRWTAEAYMMGSEARIDVFPAGDVALQEAVRILDGATSRLSAKELYGRAEAWRPYRSIAAHLLWEFYRSRKRNKDYTLQPEPTRRATAKKTISR